MKVAAAIAEILKRGPADRRGIGLKPGDIIRSIDRVELTDGVSVSQVLNDKAGETLVLQVTSSPSADMKDPRAFRKIELQAVSRGQIHDLMYDRWVDHNARRVTQLSGGKLGPEEPARAVGDLHAQLRAPIQRDQNDRPYQDERRVHADQLFLTCTFCKASATSSQ